VTLLAFAAGRRAAMRRAAAAPLLQGAGRAAIDRYPVPTRPQQQIRRTLLQRSTAEIDGQTVVVHHTVK